MKTNLFNADQLNIRYSSISAEDIRMATSDIEVFVNQKLYEINTSSHVLTSVTERIHFIDDIFGNADQLLGTINLLAFVLPLQEPRLAAQESMAGIGKIMNQLWLNKDIYSFLKNTEHALGYENISPVQKRLLNNLIREFENNGVHLEEEKRKAVHNILDRLSELDVIFESNIADYNDHLILDESDMAGLPDDYRQARITPEGNYSIGMSYPDYRPFMKYAHSQNARKQLFMKFMNRASDTNSHVLNEIIALRKQLAGQLNYQSYAQYALNNKMAKLPENVWNFEMDLLEKVRNKANSDLQILTEVKKRLNWDLPNLVFQWEASYLTDLVLREHYQLDDLLLKQYFELESVVKGTFEVANKLFGVSIIESKHPYVWHPDVRFYEVIQNGAVIGQFYLDLYPRDNKFSHAAMFPMVPGKYMADNQKKIPVAALVCNFPMPFAHTPSLLGHRDVVTFFHEFGHLLHGLLTTSEFSMMAGTSVARDFVETPSQLFENWAWEYESLSLFARHYQTGEVLPIALHQKMVNAKLFNSGLDTLQQLFYGVLDMTLHDRFLPDESMQINDVVRNLQNKLLLFPFEEGTHFECSFGHLSGYAAAYYGYMWAKVYAEDIFSVFRAQGVFSIEHGTKLREDILSKGSTVDEMDQIIHFLGRKPSNLPFLESIGCANIG